MIKRNQRGEFELNSFEDIKIGEIFLYRRWNSHRLKPHWQYDLRWSRSILRCEYYYKNRKESAIFLADDWDLDWECSMKIGPGDRCYFRGHIYVDRVKNHIKERWICNGH